MGYPQADGCVQATTICTGLTTGNDLHYQTPHRMDTLPKLILL